MINVEGVGNTDLRAFLETVGEEVKGQEKWPLTKTEVVNRFSPVITGNSHDNALRRLLNRFSNTRIIFFEKASDNRRLVDPDQVMAVAALYRVAQLEPGISPRLPILVSTTKQELGNHPLADLIHAPSYLWQRNGESIAADKAKAPPKEPSHIPKISQKQIDQARRLDAVGLDELQRKITLQPVLDKISLSGIGISPEQVLMILFIEAVGSRALAYFQPDSVLSEISGTGLRDDLIDGIKECIRLLAEYRKSAEDNGKEPTVRELGELFLRVKRRAE